MGIPIASKEIASDVRTLRKGDFLYFMGKKYKCPTSTQEEMLEVIAGIRQNLGICDEKCTGFRKFWHKLTNQR